MLYNNLTINQAGHLEVGGIDTAYLAEKYGTPLYILDEQVIREKCRIYADAMKKYFGEGSGRRIRRSRSRRCLTGRDLHCAFRRLPCRENVLPRNK